MHFINGLSMQRVKSTIPLMTTLIGLYTAQSVTGSVVQTALPVVLRDAGMSLDQIGFLSLLFLPWVLKFLWAPFVDRYGSMQKWILICQFGLIISYTVAAFFAPNINLTALIPVVLIMTVFAATQDIATDANSVYSTTTYTRSLASGASTIGGYLGFLIGAGLWLWIYAKSGWAISMLTMAACVLLLTIPTLLAKSIKAKPKPEHSKRTASLRNILENKILLRGLWLLLLWQIGVRLANAMTGPLLVDAALSLEEIAWIRGTLSMLIGLGAAVCGTYLTHRIGAKAALLVSGLFLILICTGLAIWSFTPNASAAVLINLQLALSAATALSFVAMYAIIMNWCTSSQVATDFAAVQSFDAMLAVLMGIAAGQIAEHSGYGPVFLMGALAVLCGIPLINRCVTTITPQSKTEETK